MKVRVFKINLYMLCGAVILVFFISFSAFQLFSALSPASAKILEENTIILDAGHGGVDGGAVGKNGCLEKDVNLSICLYLRDILTVNGYRVIMTRESDVSTNDEGLKKISQIKTSDLKNRLKLIESYDGAIALVIHQNEFGEEKYHGAQMFYGRKNEESKPLAEAIQKSFVTMLQPDNTRQIKPSTKSVYIVNNAKNPIVLVECGFISNYEEAKNLSDEEYQKKVAFTIFNGLVEYQKGSHNGKEVIKNG